VELEKLVDEGLFMQNSNFYSDNFNPPGDSEEINVPVRVRQQPVEEVSAPVREIRRHVEPQDLDIETPLELIPPPISRIPRSR